MSSSGPEGGATPVAEAGAAPGTGGAVMVCRQWVDRRAQVDPVSGSVRTDPRSSGASDADDAALAVALQVGATWTMPVVAVTVGPPEAEAVLRGAMELGAHRAVRVDLPADADLAPVAEALASVARACDARLVVCGDVGVYGGSGAVPAVIAHRLGVAQALGLVALRVTAAHPGRVEAWRRLDGGRREHLEVDAPCVVSVEGGAARLGRATFSRVLASAAAPTEIVCPASVEPPPARPRLRATGPLRPRTHVVPPPSGDLDVLGRVLELIGTTAARPTAQSLVLEPDEAADRILSALREWGVTS